MKMRVVYILNTSSAYGANRSLVSFINYLAGNGVKCFAILPEAGGIEEELKALGVECFIATYRACVRYPGYIGMPYLVNLVNIPRLAHQIKKWNVDIIHTNSSTHDIGIVIAKLLGKKHVWHVREVLEEHFHTTYYFPALYRKMRGKSDAVICVSNFVYNYNLEKFPNPNMKMLYNPFDLDYYNIARTGFVQKDEVNILIAGNITESKGQIEGVRALAELTHRGINNVRMILAGGAEKKCLEEIEALIAEEQLEGKVDYLGHVSDLRAVRAECDIALNCSFAEALPRVTVEGMLSELLSIGADSGGIAELIRDGITGLLYEPGNYVQLADRIEFAINNKQKCRQMIIEAKKYASANFKLETNARELLVLYEEILKDDSVGQGDTGRVKY